jgi:hypothetical protein
VSDDVVTAYTEIQLLDIYATVSEVLDAGPTESLSAAAFRVIRLNIEPPHVQRIARRILGAATAARAPLDQWRALDECAAIARQHRQHAHTKEPPP